MSFFVMPYRVLFHDTMAYGSHHFLTNFKFQCVAREQMFFEHVVEASAEGSKDHENLILLTQQAYMRGLAPVAVGQKVAVLVSAEERTLSSVRLCFRILREDGEPVSCGFQTLVCVSRDTGQVVAAPPSILRGEDLMRERLTAGSFAERVLAGKLRAVFDDEVRAIGRAVAGAPPERSYPRFLGRQEHATMAGGRTDPGLGSGVVFAFAGQGSYAPRILRQLLRELDEAPRLLARADLLARERLGTAVSDLLAAASDAEHDALLADAPGLAQVAVYLTSVLAARLLIARGLAPDVTLGHSAGELAALAVGGAYDLDTGLEAVVARAGALRAAIAAGGGMVAVFASAERTRALLTLLARPSLEIAVVNHDEQTVVSGLEPDLADLADRARALGITSHRVASAYPFHSHLLEPAVAGFRAGLRNVRLGESRIAVYSPIEGLFYRPDHIDLASHFVRPLVFPDAVRRLHAAGAKLFIECGATVLHPIIRRILREDPTVEVLKPFASDDGAALTRALARCTELGLIGAAAMNAKTIAAAERAPAPAEPTPAARAAGSAHSRLSAAPIAIVSLGAVVPGAADPASFWEQILAGRSGLSDASLDRPELAECFLRAGAVCADKTYTFLGGYVRDLGSRQEHLPFSAAELARLSLAQRLLTTSVAQCLDGLPSTTLDGKRTAVFIGATADGVGEYDEALLAVSLAEAAGSEARDASEARAFRQRIEAALGRSADDLSAIAPHASYTAVLERLIGNPVRVVCVDAACASSLYALVLGVEALRAGECDVVLAGGVFAPGPAGSCLFSQFQGLSARGSRPFDAGADGVVFGNGSAMLVLKRLSTALRDGDHVHAVVRGFGLSSDGKSPSVAVPKKAGQVLAMRRAYETTGVDPATVQYVEAHATSTVVGDTVEFSALEEVFRTAGEAASPIELGSVKALVGHTGWTAGTTSIVKMIQALEAGRLPPQGNYESPSVTLAGSPFTISTTAKPWPANRPGEPRRTAVNGFGFGGTNAHVILEEFTPSLHTERLPVEPERAEVPSLVALGVAAVFPFERGTLRFDAAEARTLPPGMMILPDVEEEMDLGQHLAVKAAGTVLGQLGPWWKEERERIGIVLGVDGKSGRSIEVNQRIYLDLLRSRLAAREAEHGALAAALTRSAERIRPSGPYTLPGLMPNVTSGRVANVFNLRGPNLVVGRQERSLFEALSAAARLLAAGTCEVVLAGALQSHAGVEAEVETAAHPARDGRPLGEAVFMVALTLAESAARTGRAGIATIDLGVREAPRVAVGRGGTPYLWSAEGAHELHAAIEQARAGRTSAVIWDDAEAGLTVAPAAGVGVTATLQPEKPRAAHREPQQGAEVGPAPTLPGERAERPRRRIQPGIRGPESPIYVTTPALVAAPLAARADTRNGSAGGRLLVLTAQSDWLDTQAARQYLHGRDYVVACPATRPVPGAVPVDLSSEPAIAESLERLRPESFATVVAVANLNGSAPIETLADDVEGGCGLLDLLFTVTRRIYPALQAGDVRLATLCLRALADESPHACSGLFSGFIKSLAREVSATAIASIISDTGDAAEGLRSVEKELECGPRPAAADIIYKAGIRHELHLRRLPGMSAAGDAWLSPESVVVVTGGGRGVSAVLVEEVLRRYRATLVLVGRTDLGQFPATVLAMSEAEFEAFEPEFYRQELRHDGRQKMADLKRRLESYRAARELRESLEGFRRLPGRIEYRPLDVIDAAAVDALVADIVARHGRLDLVIHGAALQSSRALVKKTAGEFHRIVATKVSSVANFARACARRAGRPVRHHLLTSAFSFFGNDGQPDYGAANEALARLAGQMSAETPGLWTSLGWLGWAAIGMTRASEYAEVARSRGLRAIERHEGQALFAELLAGSPTAASHVLVSDGEIAYYDLPSDGLALEPSAAVHPAAVSVPLSPARAAGNGRATDRTRLERRITLELSSHPYLHDHCVRGRPTLPATFESELAARAAKELRPAFHVVEMRETRLTRFAKLNRHGAIELRSVTEVIEEHPDEVIARVRLVSDFVHQSGRVLQSDLVHFESLVRLAPGLDLRTGHDGVPRERGLPVPDPYVSPDAPVRLDGFFRCLEAIEITAHGRLARFRIGQGAHLPLVAEFLTPAILLDALFRFSMIHLEPNGMMPVYVPLRCGRTLLVPGINDARVGDYADALWLVAPTPRIEGDRIFNRWASVETSDTRPLLMVEDLEAQRVGEVPRA
jgi:acyl transferase domain-containing protein/NAD(P)-dependent dehydrogenase (short-subunit alcohol dehydrogenase family)/acyl-CoA thioesterase FadM